MSSKRPKVHIKTEALSKPVAQLFNVLNFEDVPMPTTEFIPGPRASFGISAFLNANTASQDPDPFDFDLDSDDDYELDLLAELSRKRRFLGLDSQNGAMSHSSYPNTSHLPNFLDSNNYGPDTPDESSTDYTEASESADGEQEQELTFDENQVPIDHLEQLQQMAYQKLYDLIAELQWARSRAAERESADLGQFDESLALEPLGRFENDPLAIHLCRLTRKLPQSTTRPLEQLKFIPGEWPEASDSAYFPLPRKPTSLKVSKRALNPANTLMEYVNKVNLFDYNPGFTGKPALGRPSFCPARGSCVGVVPTTSGANMNDLIFFSWYGTHSWPRAIPESVSYPGRRMGARGSLAANPNPRPRQSTRNQCNIIIGGTTRLKSAVTVDGVVWTDSNEIAVHGSDDTSSAILQRFLVDWQVAEVKARPSGAFRLPMASAVTEMEKSPISKRLLSGHDEGSVCIFDWEKLKPVPIEKRTSLRSTAQVNSNHPTPFYDHPSPNADGEVQLDLTTQYPFPHTKGRDSTFSAHCFQPARVKPSNCRTTKATTWKFDHRVGSVRWCPGSAELASVTLDNGQFHLLDTRTGGIVSSYTKSTTPAYSHDYGIINEEVIIGDCRGIISIHDLRRLGDNKYAPYTFKDPAQGVIGDVRFNPATSTLAISGSPSVSFWNRRQGWSLVGSTYVDDASLLPASHCTHIANAPGTTIYAATTSAGSLALYDC